ncbi:MAG: hypothetical protein WCS96_11760, partial [Victivallales bacterium]
RLSLLEIDLLTGKKNQIRVHFFEKGHTVVNDDKYTRDRRIEGRLALHSQSLTFNHPHSGRRMTFEAKIPDYFNELMARG